DNGTGMGIFHQLPVTPVREAPRHPEVHQENEPAFEPDDQILASPIDRAHAFAFELRGHLCRLERPGQPGVRDLDALEGPSDEIRLEADTNRLDLGQLGHGLSLAPAYCVRTPRITFPADGGSGPIE